MLSDTPTMQRLLNLAGFNAGAVDGIIGRKTRAALEKWYAAVADIARAAGTLDPRSEKNVLDLLPEFQYIIRRWFLAQAIPAAEEMGLTVKIICGTRTFAEQAALYAKGRTAPGPRVTNAKPGSSFHNYGCAIDVCLFTASGQPTWDDSLYRQFFAAAGIPSQCRWGGNFKSLSDTPHVEYIAAGATTAELKKYSNS